MRIRGHGDRPVHSRNRNRARPRSLRTDDSVARIAIIVAGAPIATATTAMSLPEVRTRLGHSFLGAFIEVFIGGKRVP